MGKALALRSPRPSDQILFRWRDAFLEKDSGLTSTQRLTLMVLSTFMDMKGAGAFPSQDTIAEQAGLSIKAVKRSMKAMEASGWIAREPRRRGARRSFRYGTEYCPRFPSFEEPQTPIIGGTKTPIYGPHSVRERLRVIALDRSRIGVSDDTIGDTASTLGTVSPTLGSDVPTISSELTSGTLQVDLNVYRKEVLGERPHGGEALLAYLEAQPYRFITKAQARPARVAECQP